MNPRPLPALNLLDPRLRGVLGAMGWRSLHPVQERSIHAIAQGGDVLIVAPTAGGKTEAAALPLLTTLSATLRSEGTDGVVLWVSPLKALINDTTMRLARFGAAMNIAVTPWHGDVPESVKRAFRDHLTGILVITPESLEGMLARGDTGALAGLHAVVVDEVHAFLDVERGAQLQSLLHRVDDLNGHPIPRIGLSATVGDTGLAARQLRPGDPGSVRLIVEVGKPNAEVTVHGYEEVWRTPRGRGLVLSRVTRQIYEDCIGTFNIVFGNRRQDVEAYTHELNALAGVAGQPAFAHAHHGSLSRHLRRAAERALKDRSRPATIVATSTLELGIDVGSVHAIGQIGPASSVSSARQRLGRSGRRGEPAVYRCYIPEMPAATENPEFEDQMRARLVQTMAVIDLVLDGWCEPPSGRALHASTLVQQLLSHLLERGGSSPATAYEALCAKDSPFSHVTEADFNMLLDKLHDERVVTHRASGDLFLAEEGERITGSFDFYTAFLNPVEWRFVHNGRPIATVESQRKPWRLGDRLLLGARPWQITGIRPTELTITVVPAAFGMAPSFRGDAPPVHTRVRQQMREILAGRHVPDYLDPEAAHLLGQGRRSFTDFGLTRGSVVPWDEQTLLVPWIGTQAHHTLGLQLRDAGFEVTDSPLTLTVEAALAEVLPVLNSFAAAGPADAIALARTVEVQRYNKHDHLLFPEMLNADYAARALDTGGAYDAINVLAADARRLAE